MRFAEHDDVVEALAAERADQSLRVRILPGAAWRTHDFVDADAGHAPPELGAVDLFVAKHTLRAANP